MGRLRAWWAARSRRARAATIGAILIVLVIAGAAGRTASPAIVGDGVAALGDPIPGLTAADVKLNVQDRGLTCTGPETLNDGISYDCRGTSGDANIQWQVELYGSDPTTIRSVLATVLWFGPGSAETAMDEFLGYIATLPYDRSTPGDAQAWVTATNAGERTFGAVTYSITSADTGRTRTLAIRGGTGFAVDGASPRPTSAIAPSIPPVSTGSAVVDLAGVRDHILRSMDALDAQADLLIAAAETSDVEGTYAAMLAIQAIVDAELTWSDGVPASIAADPVLAGYRR